MNNSKLYLFIAVLTFSFLNCKEVPTFENEGINNPTSPDYIVRDIDQFEIIKNLNQRKAYFFVKYTHDFPYDGFLIEHREANSGDDFRLFTVVDDEEVINDSLFYVMLDDIPNRFNEFKIRAYSDLAGERIVSEPLYAGLNQHVFQFRKESISSDSTDNDLQLIWYHNFLTNIPTKYKIHFFLHGVNGEEAYYESSIESNIRHLNVFDTGITEIETIEYSILKTDESVTELTQRHPFFVDPINCIETRENYSTFIMPPDSLAYVMTSSDIIEFSWQSECSVDEVQIVRDDGGIFYPENKPWPNVVIESKQMRSGVIGKILEPNVRRSFTQLWLQAIVDSVVIEAQSPYRRMQ